MKMTFRWFGPDDPVTLTNIKQVPVVAGLVSALYDVPVGEVWELEGLAQLKGEIEDAGFSFDVVESIPVHEDIKLGRPSRDRFIEAYCRSVQHMGQLRIPVLCYNFMPVFDWMRTDLAKRLENGASTLAYDHEELARIDLSKGTGELPGWATAYSRSELDTLLAAYGELDEEQLWDHLAYFLEQVVPVAAESDVRLAIHPDDPPWSVFGLPRIIIDEKALQRVLNLVDKSANGLTLCTGSLGANPENDLPTMTQRLGKQGRIHFVHCRNIKVTGEKRFYESPHPSACGDVDVFRVLKALNEVGFAGPMRADHGRMIWGETGRPGYGLHDRALGAMYLSGLWEAIAESKIKED